MIIIQNNAISALSAIISDAEKTLLPFQHESGAAFWIVDEHGKPSQTLRRLSRQPQAH